MLLIGAASSASAQTYWSGAYGPWTNGAHGPWRYPAYDTWRYREYGQYGYGPAYSYARQAPGR